MRGTRSIAANSILVLTVVAAALFAFFFFTSRTFASSYNLLAFLRYLSFFVIVAIGETLVLISGNLDFSIGGVIALTSVVVGKLYESGVSIYLAMALGLLVGLVTGAINGWLVTKMRLNSIIVTLGTSAITSGLAFVLSNAMTLAVFEDVLGFIGRGSLFSIPFPVILMAVVVAIASIVLHKTKLGLRIYAIGSSNRVAYMAGINTQRISGALYMVCGLTSSIGGLVITSLSAVGMPRHGVGQEITIITAVILGGVPLAGGRGSALGTLVGMIIIQLIFNGLTQLNVIPYYIQMIQGLLLITIVIIYVRSEQAARGRTR
jgi:ribose/xylose/arabinose/galactoside ABC-type transport system permease subunit